MEPVSEKMRDLGNLSRHSKGFLGFMFTGFEKMRKLYEKPARCPNK